MGQLPGDQDARHRIVLALLRRILTGRGQHPRERADEGEEDDSGEDVENSPSDGTRKTVTASSNSPGYSSRLSRRTSMTPHHRDQVHPIKASVLGKKTPAAGSGVSGQV